MKLCLKDSDLIHIEEDRINVTLDDRSYDAYYTRGLAKTDIHEVNS